MPARGTPREIGLPDDEREGLFSRLKNEKSIPLDLARGVWQIVKSAASDVSQAFAPPEMDTQGNITKEKPIVGRSQTLDNLALPFAESMRNTWLLELPSFAMNIGGPLGELGGLEDKFRERYREILQQEDEFRYERPILSAIEDIGNISIVGALVSGGSSAAASAAAKAGRVGRANTLRQVSSAASKSISHPYRATGRVLKESRPGQLFREAAKGQGIGRAEAFNRLRARYGSEEGAITLRPDDPRRRWNELQDEITEAQSALDSSRYGPDSATRKTFEEKIRKASIQRMQVEYELQGMGIEPPRRGRFEPDDVPIEDLVGESDFSWGGSEGDFWKAQFITSTINPVARVLGDNVPKDTVGVLKHQVGDGWDIYATSPEGQVIGVLSVGSDGAHVAVYPEYQGQGVAKRLGEKAAEEIPADVLESAMRNSQMSEFGGPYSESMRRLAVEKGVFSKGTDPVTGKNKGTPNEGQVPRETVSSYSGSQSSNLDMLMDMLRSEEGSITLGGRIKPKGEGSIGPVDYGAILAGSRLFDVTQTPAYQSLAGPTKRGAKKVANAFASEKILKSQEARRELDPSRTERVLLRDLQNLEQINPEVYLRIADEIAIDRITPGSVPKRVGEVATGKRSIGQTRSSEEIVRSIRAVTREADRISKNNPGLTYDAALETILPNVNPLSIHLLELNYIEKINGLPNNSLTAALGDYLELDDAAFANRAAQKAMAEAGQPIDPAAQARYRVPEDELSVDIRALSDEHQQAFYDAARETRRRQARIDEAKVEAGNIPRAGTRAGLGADEPTFFDVKARPRTVGDEVVGEQPIFTDRPITRAQKYELRQAAKAEAKQGRVVENLRKNIERLTDQDAINRNQAKLAREKENLLVASSRLHEIERMVHESLEGVPVVGREYLTYTRAVAPRQAAHLRAIADEGIGDPVALNALADELEALPKTIEELNSAQTHITYLKRVKDRGEYTPQSAGARDINTRPPGGLRRRGSATDVEFSRDFRARSFLAESEFQRWFLAKQGDATLRNMGLVKTGREWLQEQGIAVESLTNNQIQQTLERMGMKAYHPSDTFGVTSRKPRNIAAVDGDWVNGIVDQTIEKALKPVGPVERFFAEGIWDPITQTWKVSALPLRLAWQINNAFGNALLTMWQGGVSPFNYASMFKASAKAVHNWNKGINSEIVVPVSRSMRESIVAAINNPSVPSNHKVMLKEALDTGHLSISNKVLEDIASSGLTRGDFAWMNNSQFLRDFGQEGTRQNALQQLGIKVIPEKVAKSGVGQRVGNLRQTGREFVDFAYHVNEAVDNFHRTLVYLDQMGKGVPHEQAMTQVVKTLGDYKKLTPFERRVVKRIYPFYPWMRHITEVTLRSFSPDQITRTMIVTHLLTLFGQPNEFEQMLPEWAKGHIMTGMSEDGVPEFMSTRGLNPFLDVFDPVAQPNMRGLLRPIHPIIGAGVEQLTGVSQLTGRPFSSPVQPADGTTPRPPVSEQFVRAVPQLRAGRDVYRDLMGQPLTRYGTGEPAFFPGAEEGKSGLQSVATLFGYNVRPLDVERMNAQEMRRLQEEMMQRFRQEQQEKTQGGRTLGSLFPGGGD